MSFRPSFEGLFILVSSSRQLLQEGGYSSGQLLLVAIHVTDLALKDLALKVNVVCEFLGWTGLVHSVAPGRSISAQARELYRALPFRAAGGRISNPARWHARAGTVLNLVRTALLAEVVHAERPSTSGAFVSVLFARF